VQGFHVGNDGTLHAIPGSARPLSSGASGPAEIGFTPDGEHLIVTEKATSLLSVYGVASDGSLTGPVTTPSSGTTPFGFGFDNRGTLVVSEAFGGGAGASALSSYRVGRDGSVTLVTGSAPTTQTAACWIAVSDNNHFAYTANAGSATITGYSIGADGALSRIDAGVTATTGAGPTELAFSNGSRYLYVLNGGARSIGGYAVAADGSLQALPATPGLVSGVNGLAAR
jgi:6-phosphogluconolactonase (cycloisomerase 2 family)